MISTTGTYYLSWLCFELNKLYMSTISACPISMTSVNTSLSLHDVCFVLKYFRKQKVVFQIDRYQRPVHFVPINPNRNGNWKLRCGIQPLRHGCALAMVLRIKSNTKFALKMLTELEWVPCWWWMLCKRQLTEAHNEQNDN